MKETWKDIKGYEGSYQVSNLGRVRSLDRIIHYNNNTKHLHKGKILKPTTNGRDYYSICLSTNMVWDRCYVHRLVAQAFIPNPLNKPQINHKNGIKYDSKVKNLEWCTNNENRQHAVKNGLIARGEKFIISKLTNKQVRVIKYCLKIGMKQKDIAKYFPTRKENINAIKRNVIWKHIKI